MNTVGNQPALRAAHPGTDAERSQPPRILVVDDDALVYGVVTASLEDAGFQVQTATDGEDAWRKLLADDFDLLVAADLLPKASGLALIRRMRVAAMALPVVLASERLDADDAARLNRDPWSRFDALVPKPFTISQLLATVQAVLDQRASAPRITVRIS